MNRYEVLGTILAIGTMSTLAYSAGVLIGYYRGTEHTKREAQWLANHGGSVYSDEWP